MLIGRIEGPYFVAGFVVEDDGSRVFAPIIKYMKNWPLAKIVGYSTNKGWDVSVIDPKSIHGTKDTQVKEICLPS